MKRLISFIRTVVKIRKTHTASIFFILLVFPLQAQLSVNDIDGINGFSMTGLYDKGRLGSHVAYIGDINRDGFDDISVSASAATPDTLNQTGEIYIIFGHNSNTDASFDLSQLDGTNGFRVRGVNAGDQLGYGGANAAGDINNDGIDDVILSTPYTDSDNLETGSAYILFGRTNGFPPAIDLDTLHAAYGLTLNGRDLYYENFGTAGGYAGDMNGDNIDDFFVTADDADFTGSSSGTLYVIYGQNNFPDSLDVDTLSLNHGFLIHGKNAGDNLGIAAASLKDINGDGLNDLSIGAFHANGGTGAAYVVFGRNTNFEDTVYLASLDGTIGFELLGAAVGDRTGNTIGDAGDLNGDGLHDLFIGAKRASTDSLAYAGKVYVVYGSTTPWLPVLHLDSLSASQGFTIQGSQAAGFAGNSVYGPGDVNADGRDDLLIGVPFSSSGGLINNGTAYILFGRSGAFPAIINLHNLSKEETLVIRGADHFARLGFSVNAGGDFNRDGISDFIMGADYGAPFANHPGAAYLIYGQVNLSFASSCLQNDYTALRALYLSTDGDNWANNSGWPTAAFFNANPLPPTEIDMASWHGVNIDIITGCINIIDLSNNNLNGNIPLELSNLSNLQVLNLSANQLNGSIPPELVNLTNLTALWLYSNQLSGNIPTVLGDLSRLVHLDLSGNFLSGGIPVTFGNLGQLEFLSLADNLLTGNIPATFGNLDSLSNMWLYDNQLTGCYDENLLGLCTQLDVFLHDFAISTGNNFDASWASFCTNGTSTCPPCLSSRIINGNIPTDLYQADQHILSNGIILTGSNVQFKAGTYILLDNNFTIEPNASFSAEIDGCN